MQVIHPHGIRSMATHTHARNGYHADNRTPGTSGREPEETTCHYTIIYPLETPRKLMLRSPVTLVLATDTAAEACGTVCLLLGLVAFRKRLSAYVVYWMSCAGC